MKKLLVKIFLISIVSISSMYATAKFCERIMITHYQRAKKNAYNFRGACKWLQVYQNQKSIVEQLKKKNINEVAIYGLGELGQCLLKELINSEIKVKYIIDKNISVIENDIMFYFPTDELPKTQAIIITPIYEYEEISKKLRVNENVLLLSLETLIEESM